MNKLAASMFIALCIAATILGCSSGGGGDDPRDKVANPSFAPPAGIYTSTRLVTISSSTYGAAIRYTEDGSSPSSTVGTLYTGPVPVTESLTLKAIAFKEGMDDSSVVSAAYEIVFPVAAPVFEPPGGVYTSVQTVAITSATDGAEIRYTLDGSDPKTSTYTVYTGQFELSENTTVKAYAVKSGMSDSDTSSASYEINTTPPNSLRFTVVGDPDNLDPVEGFPVIVHKAEGPELVYTDSEGVADFGEVIADAVTVTFACDREVNSNPQYFLKTHIGLTNGEHLVPLSTVCDWRNLSPVASMTIDIADSDNSLGVNEASPLELLLLSPSMVTWDEVTSMPVMAPGEITSSDLQTDGNLSLLALAFDLDPATNGSSLREFGFLADKTPTEGGSLTVDLNTAPANLEWSTDGPGINRISLRGKYKGVWHGDFILKSTYSFQMSPPGIVPSLSGFPFEKIRYRALRVTDSNISGAKVANVCSKTFDGYQGFVAFTIPDYDFDAFSYDQGEKALSYTLASTVTAPIHFAQAWADGVLPASNKTWKWVVHKMQPGGSATISFPSLPSPISSWVDMSVIGSMDLVVGNWDTSPTSFEPPDGRFCQLYIP